MSYITTKDNTLRILLLLLLSTTCFAQTAKEATVRVYTITDANEYPRYWGSGVLISDTLILTNSHVVEDRREGDKALQIRFSDGHRSWATVEASDFGNDVALLKTTPHPTFKPVEIGEDITYETKVKCYGYTYDYDYTESTGWMWHRRTITRGDSKQHVSSEFDEEGNCFALVGGQRVPGDSGGPVMKDNKVVGIIQSIGTLREAVEGEEDLTTPITICVRLSVILPLIDGKIKMDLKIK